MRWFLMSLLPQTILGFWEFKGEHLGLSHILPPLLQVWLLLYCQNTAEVAITYRPTRRGRELGTELRLSPFRDSWCRGTQERVWGHHTGQTTNGPGPFSTGGEPLPALCRFSYLPVIFSVFSTPLLCLLLCLLPS